MTIRDILKKNSLARSVYFRVLFLNNVTKSLFSRFNILISQPLERNLLRSMRQEVRSLYQEKINLTNPTRYYIGKNVLGYPTMSFLLKDGLSVGWESGRITQGGFELVIMQLSVDREVNFPKLFQRYRPEVIVDFGTASGGTAVFFHTLVSNYSTPKILSVDISNQDYLASAQFHKHNRTEEKINFVFGKSSLECFEEVGNFLKKRVGNQKVMLSFDDNHSYEHTYNELNIFSPLLRSGDVILMQDTWNQDLFGHEVSPMLAVHRFLKENKDFKLDTDFNKSLQLPCNFIYGVIIKL